MSELREIEDEMRQHPDPVVSVPELEDRLGYSDTKIRDDLKLLEREGVVHSKQVGARATAWWHEDRVCRPHVAPEDHPDQRDLESSADRHEAADSAAAETASVTVEDAVDQLDLPGQGEKQKQRREAMKALLRHLRDGGDTKGSELQTLIFEHHETGYQSADSWWGNCAHPALKDLGERGFVELTDRHNGVWSWTGESV